MAAAPASRRSRAWRVAAFVAVAAVGMGLAALAGWWQWNRFEERQSAIAEFDAAAQAPALTLSEVRAAESPGGLNYRRLTVSGEFVAGSQQLLRNRTIGGRPAAGVLAVLDTAAGPLVVHVGWLDFAPDGEAPALPDGQQTLTVILRPFEPDDGRRGDGATRIAPAQLGISESAVAGMYGVLLADCGDCAAALDATGSVPVRVDRPAPGPHLSYALQWWTLTLLLPVGGVLLARRDLAEATGDSPAKPPASPRPRRASATDEEIEDAL